MIDKAAWEDPGTRGTVRGSRRVGPFLITETHHAQGLYLPPHEHARASLNFVLSGAYGESFRSSFMVFPANTLLYKPGGAGHANRFNDTPPRCLLVEVDSEALADSLGQSAERDPDVRRDPRLALLATRAHRLLSLHDDLAELILEELVTELFASLASPIPGASATITAAEEFLRSSFREPCSLRDVARQVDLHPAHLGRAFRKKHGCSVGEYVRNLRVLAVAHGLRLSTDTIADLSHAAGFADQSHCTRVFSGALGISPARYRALVKA